MSMPELRRNMERASGASVQIVEVSSLGQNMSNSLKDGV